MPVRRYIVVFILARPFPALADSETIPGPIVVDVVQVIDGDTIEVNAHPWPGMTVRVLVRLDTIDAPEIAGKCPEEKALAIRARNRLRALAGSTVQLVDVRRGRLARRVRARVQVDGRPVGAVLVAEGLARPYDGGKREGWC